MKPSTYRSDDLIPAESRKLPTWLSSKNHFRRQRELLTMLPQVAVCTFVIPGCLSTDQVEAYDALLGRLEAIREKINRFGAVLYGRRTRQNAR